MLSPVPYCEIIHSTCSDITSSGRLAASVDVIKINFTCTCIRNGHKFCCDRMLRFLVLHIHVHSVLHYVK